MKVSKMPFWAPGLVLSLTLLNSCQKDLEKATPGQKINIETSDTTGSRRALEVFPGQTGILRTGTYRGNSITYSEINGKAVWQGDIILSERDLAPVEKVLSKARVSGAGRADTDYRWQDFTIPYKIDGNLSSKEVNAINAAMAHWQDKTPIKFVPRTTQVDYVRFIRSATNGNSSSVGRQHGMQEIELQSNVPAGVAIHEIGHAIGLFHEHTRTDRDKYVIYKKENVKPGEEHNFNKFSSEGGFDFNEFDFLSIMLYDSYAFSKNGQPTLTRKDGSTYTVNRTELSSGDIRTVLSMYSNLYIAQFGTLYAVNPSDGDYTALEGGNWAGASKTIAEDDRYVWLIQGGKLWKTDRFSGTFHAVGNGDWTGAVGVTGKDPQGNLYAQQGIRLWKIDKNGNHTRLGGVNALENWSGTQAVYYHNNALYVIQKNTLYKINTTSGLVDKVYGGNWFDIKGMSAVRGSSTDLYIMLSETLWRVNTVTGAFTAVSGGFPKTEGMAGVGGSLYIVSGGNLYRVKKMAVRPFYQAAGQVPNQWVLPGMRTFYRSSFEAEAESI